jgi:hypothetical protein
MKQRAKNGGNDAYYTNPSYSEHCVQTVATITTGSRFSAVIEPSAGNGSFLKPLSKKYRNVIAYDLYPKSTQIISANWFEVDVPKNSLVVGNPPFGFAASLAVRFFNHAAQNAKVIAFIVPRSFQKTSIKNKLNPSFHLIYEEICPDNCFLLDNNPYDVPCVFQIWEKRKVSRQVDKPVGTNPFFEFVTPVNADFCVRRVGGRAGQLLDGINHNRQTTYFVRSLHENAQQAVIDCLPALEKLRDMTAGVRSISKAELNAVLTAYYIGESK